MFIHLGLITSLVLLVAPDIPRSPLLPTPENPTPSTPMFIFFAAAYCLHAISGYFWCLQSSHPNPSSDFTPFHKWWKLTKHDQAHPHPIHPHPSHPSPSHPHPIHPHASGVAGPARQVHPGVALRVQRQPQLRQRHAARGVRGSLQASKQRRGSLRVSPNGGRSPERRLGGLGGLGGWEERNDFFGSFWQVQKTIQCGAVEDSLLSRA